jgi:hypothetical protein
MQASRWLGLPSQAPPQTVPSSVQAGRARTGAPVAGAQVPADDGRLHASHWPVQAPSQQTPSTQWPLVHIASRPHAAPRASLASHTPPAHHCVVVGAQSGSTVQPDVQAVAPQACGAHGSVWSAGQWPAPSHDAETVATPAEHEAARQDLAAPGKAQAVRSVPSQVPPQTVPSDSQARRVPTGAPATAVQVPTRLAWSQASHWPVQALSQQTPSAQWPLVHCPSAPQALAAASFGAHTPPEHQSVPGHCPSEVHEPAPAQAFGPHVSGLHACVCRGGHWPWPLQTAGRTAVAALQLGGRHETASAG